MKITAIVLPNQNQISKSESEKIRRAIKKDFPEAQVKIRTNERAEKILERGVPEGHYMVFETHDVNYDVNYDVWASLDCHRSSIEGRNTHVVALN